MRLTSALKVPLSWSLRFDRVGTFALATESQTVRVTQVIVNNSLPQPSPRRPLCLSLAKLSLLLPLRYFVQLFGVAFILKVKCSVMTFRARLHKSAAPSLCLLSHTEAATHQPCTRCDAYRCRRRCGKGLEG